MWTLLMARRALTVAMIVLAASASHAIAKVQQISCQLSGMAIGQGSPNQRIYKTLVFNLDDSSGQLNSGINGVLATTLGFSDREIVVRLRDIALTGDAAPSLFGNALYNLDASQSNFFLDRVTGNAVLSATYLSTGVVFAVGPCGQFAPRSNLIRVPFGAERD
jgi:hypothetical protein